MKKSVSFIVAILTLAILVATSGCTSNKSNLSAQDYNQQGLSLATQGKYKDAVASYTRAIQLNSQEAQFYVNRGTAYLNMKEFDLAIADFDQAIKLDPNLAEAYAGRGYAYMNKGGVYLNLAIADFNSVLLKSKNADLINYAKQMLENLTKTPPFLAVIPLPPVIDTPPEPIIIDGTQKDNVTPPDLGLPSTKDLVQSSRSIDVLFRGHGSAGYTLTFGTFGFGTSVLMTEPLSTDDRKETSTGMVWQGNSFSIKNERLGYWNGLLSYTETVEVSGTVSNDWRQILNVRVSSYFIAMGMSSSEKTGTIYTGKILEETTMEFSAVNIPFSEPYSGYVVYSLSGPQVQGHIVDARRVSIRLASSSSHSLSDIEWNSPNEPSVEVRFRRRDW